MFDRALDLFNALMIAMLNIAIMIIAVAFAAVVFPSILITRAIIRVGMGQSLSSAVKAEVAWLRIIYGKKMEERAARGE